MSTRVHLATAILMGMLVLVPAGAGPLSTAHGTGGLSRAGAVEGVVRDSGGTPQLRAVVELLRSGDLSVAATVYTDAKGRYAFHPVVPGRYAVEARGASFLPALREGI